MLDGILIKDLYWELNKISPIFLIVNTPTTIINNVLLVNVQKGPQVSSTAYFVFTVE